jgi:hypothetical protein
MPEKQGLPRAKWASGGTRLPLQTAPRRATRHQLAVAAVAEYWSPMHRVAWKRQAGVARCLARSEAQELLTTIGVDECDIAQDP